MIELIKLVAALCTIHGGNNYNYVRQAECQAELLWCVAEHNGLTGKPPEKEITPGAALSGCIVKRAAVHDWWKPEAKK